MPNNSFTINLSSRLTPLMEYLQKQRENRKFLQTIELSATFILISFFLFFAIKPTFLTISTLLGDIKSKEVLSQEMKNKINQVIQAQETFALIQEKYDVIDSSLPSRPRFYQAAHQINELSSQNQINVDKLIFAAKEGNFYSTNVSTSSSFTSGLNLIALLQSNRRVFEIPSVSFSSAKDSSSTRQIYLSLPINVYYWNESNEKK